VYVRRKLAPTWPVKTRPSLTPMCTGSGSPRRRSHDGPEHPLLVVSEGLRSARDEDDPSAVAVDIALEERHRVLVGRALDAADERVERVRAASGPSVSMISSVPEKRTNAIAACRCSPSSGPTSSSCARGARDGELERDALDARQRLDRPGRRAPRRSRPRSFSSPESPLEAAAVASLRGSPRLRRQPPSTPSSLPKAR
jgi:hypothetical protein